MVKGVKGFRRGHKGLTSENRHFEIILFFKKWSEVETKEEQEDQDPEERVPDLKPVTLLDTKNNVRASQWVKTINNFLSTLDIKKVANKNTGSYALSRSYDFDVLEDIE